jgi:hypothetical protein
MQSELLINVFLSSPSFFVKSGNGITISRVGKEVRRHPLHVSHERRIANDELVLRLWVLGKGCCDVVNSFVMSTHRLMICEPPLMYRVMALIMSITASMPGFHLG